MPTLVGPLLLSAALNFSAMMSKASSQLTGVNSPFLSKRPSVLRSSGCVSRSLPYMIFDRKYPFTQLRPRFTSDLMSPCVAMTRLSLVATMTLQPVPQNRHGALSQFSNVSGRSVKTLAAFVGSVIPPAAAARVAASSFSTARRLNPVGAMMRVSCRKISVLVHSVKNERRREHVRQQRDLREAVANGLSFGGVQNDHELAVRIALGDLRAGDALDRGLDCGEVLGSRLDQHAGNFGRVVGRRAGRRVGDPLPSDELSAM